MPNLGIHVYEKATAVAIPVVADVGIPFVVGLAPVHTAAKPAKANVPVLCTSWDEAVEKLGFSYDWKKYTICEFIYSHFQLFGCQPVIFCNVLDTDTMKNTLEAKEYDVSDHKITLPFDTIAAGLKVSVPGDGGADPAELKPDEDYTVLYDENDGVCIVELLSSGSAYSAAKLSVSGSTVDTSAVVTADVVSGLGVIDACMSMVGVIPDLICAPGFSHLSVVAAIMATKAAGINGLFRAKALVDVDCGAEGVTEYSALTPWKNKNNMVDENQILCWPMVKLGDYKFHMSTQLAGLMAKVDTDNAGVPYESPSNKNYKMDGCCLEDGTEVNLTFEQSNIIAGYGIVTALNFMSMGWTCRNNYTACYPANTDVKDQFIPVSRMFDFVGNTLIRTFWSKLDKPMNRRLIDTIIDTCNIWLNGLVSQEYLLGARAEYLEEENSLVDLMAGILHIHIYITPPSPMQECDFTLEYDTNYVTSALAA
ncbi:phage tail protein [uncultured Oscillibacter sp.]|uniref:phage tail sheath family protein n=1 Tax=uncultured Oscillibacter sp. TaxID=876091 RepID=UPI002604997D|nr:phage tail protein [uncultured Oscillibacter sp.]